MINVWRSVFGFLAMFGMLAVCNGAERIKLLNADSGIAPGKVGEAQGMFVTGDSEGILSLEGVQNGIRMLTPPGGVAWGQVVDRPVDQLSTLTWAWRTLPPEEPRADDLPIRLIVGYVDGPMPQRAAELRINGLPTHNRALLVVWGSNPNDEGRRERVEDYARYFANAGKTNGGWWEQTLDLRSLHQTLWPNVPIQNVRIAFVAVATRDSAQFSQADVMRIELASPPQVLP